MLRRADFSFAILSGAKVIDAEIEEAILNRTIGEDMIGLPEEIICGEDGLLRFGNMSDSSEEEPTFLNDAIYYFAIGILLLFYILITQMLV